MNRVHCTNCGRDGHPKWQCPYPPKESTAARKDVRRDLAPAGVRDNSTARVDGSLQGRHLPREDHKPSAGTQALPVDISRLGKKALAGDMPRVNEHPETEGKLVQVQQSQPATKFDKKAWMREYMRDHRKGILRRARKKSSAVGKNE